MKRAKACFISENVQTVCQQSLWHAVFFIPGEKLCIFRTPPGSFALRDSNKCVICAKAKRQQQMFYLRESEASATNVLSVRKRSDSNKAPGRNGNQPTLL